jgi:hypothetical protein
MQQSYVQAIDTKRYARCIEVSKRIRWDIDRDVIRGRRFDTGSRFLPDGLALAGEFAFLGGDERRFASQIQGRTYANMFGLVERFIGAKILETSREHWLGDQVALEALVRFTDEELKHQALFRRLDEMMAAQMPAGYRFMPEPNAVARAVLARSTWSVLALTSLIELFTQAHYRRSIEPDAVIDPLWKDVFLFHWKEESQHAILDELEWKREDARLGAAERDSAVGDLIALVGAVDGILQAQAASDAGYFAAACGRRLEPAEQARIESGLLKAYRWQYIVSGVQVPHFAGLLAGMVTPAQHGRIVEALGPILAHVSGSPLRAAA